MGHRIRLDHLNHVCSGRCGASAYRVSATGSAQHNPTMTGFNFGDDLADLTFDKLLPYKLLSLLTVPNVRHYYSSFRIGRLYSSFNGDAGLTPNAPMNGAGVRSTEASVPLAG